MNPEAEQVVIPEKEVPERNLLEEKLATERILTTIGEQGKVCNDMVQKLKQQLESNNLSTKEGLTFLEVKNHLLLQYLISLTGLTLQKVSGKSIQDSSYLHQIVETRTFMEKMRPIENKLKYQIDKLVSTAVQGKASSGSDPLKFRANLDALQKDDDDDEDYNSDEDDESDEDDVGGVKSSNIKPGIYRPPKVAPTHYDEDEKGPSSSKKTEQHRKKSINQTLIRDLQEEFLDTPIEIHNMGDAYAKQLSRDVKDKERYEETYMTRLAVTKKDKHRDRALSTIGVLGDEITDFKKKVPSGQSGGGNRGKKRKFSGKGKKGSSGKKFRRK